MRLRQERLKLGANQRDFAKLGGVGLGSQHRYEAGDLPPIDYLLRIGEAGADWYWIVTGQRADMVLTAYQAALLDAAAAIGADDQAVLLRIATALGGTPPTVQAQGQAFGYTPDPE